MALQIYLFIAIASAVALVWRHPLAEIAGQAAAPIGAAFTLVCLATGSLWGRPMWGAWWVWDARLTSVLVLFFLYLGYIALVNAFDDRGRGARAGALLALVGVVNLPIIKFSVDWWNTLHQPASVVRLGGPSIALSMLLPLLVMAIGVHAAVLLAAAAAHAHRAERAQDRGAAALRAARRAPDRRRTDRSPPPIRRCAEAAAMESMLPGLAALGRPVEFDGRIRGLCVAGLRGRGRGARRSLLARLARPSGQREKRSTA